MISLFSAPKPFRGHIGDIQKNALASWIRLSPPCEIILFGDEKGTAEMATRFGVRHVPEVLRNEYGTPLLNDLFEKAQAMATHNLMCYVNADIILMSDFMRATERVRRLKKSFLMVGRRLDIDLEQSLNVEQPDWEERFRLYAREHGKPRPAEWIDYFVFPRGLYQDLLPFAIGRAAFDNWLLWKARSLGAPVVDASEAVLAVHQNHDYSHHPQGQKGVWEGSEAKSNIALLGGGHHCFTLADATHSVTPTGLKLNLSGEYFRRRWEVAVMALRSWTLPVRHRLGLRRSNMDHLSKVIRRALSPFSKRNVG